MDNKPKYNPKIHHRRSIRLKGYDYSQAGAYFVTICCQNLECKFGHIVGAGFTPAPNKNDDNDYTGQPQGIAPTMVLNEYGTVAYNEWIKLADRYPNFELNVFQIMPNHMHGIVVLTNVGAGFTPAQNGQPQGLPLRNATVDDIIGAYKSLVANECLKIFKSKWAGVNPVGAGVNPERAGVNPAPTMGKLWQPNYYEHVIRNEQSYQTISNYIINNPSSWKGDKFYK